MKKIAIALIALQLCAACTVSPGYDRRDKVAAKTSLCDGKGVKPAGDCKVVLVR